MGMRTVRIGSWNIARRDVDLSAITAERLDVLLLQEVTPAAFERFRVLFHDAAFSLNVAFAHGEPRPSHGVAVLWSARLAGRGSRVLSHVVLPHRFLICDLAFVEQRGYFHACSYHAINGEQGEDGLDKPRFTYQVADWLEGQPLPVVLGMDANSPDIDHPDFAQTRCHFDWLGPRHFERALLGPEARHRLVDTYRAWLTDHPDRLDAIQTERPNGPLAESHRTGRNQTAAGNPRRYDHIYATAGDFRVVDAAYDYDAGWAAGSDHAIVTAELQVQLAAGQRPERDFPRLPSPTP